MQGKSRRLGSVTGRALLCLLVLGTGCADSDRTHRSAQMGPEQACTEKAEVATYDSFKQTYPEAHHLIEDVSRDLGGTRLGQCATLNASMGYALRQLGFQTILVTGEVSCPDAPGLSHMDAGYHIWLLVSDGRSVWHVDAANPFLIIKWQQRRLSSEAFDAFLRGRYEGEPEPLDSTNVLWGSPGDAGIKLEAGTLRAFPPFYDVLGKIGKRDVVCSLFRAYGFQEPYTFSEGILDAASLNLPPAEPDESDTEGDDGSSQAEPGADQT